MKELKKKSFEILEAVHGKSVELNAQMDFQSAHCYFVIVEYSKAEKISKNCENEWIVIKLEAFIKSVPELWNPIILPELTDPCTEADSVTQ